MVPENFDVDEVLSYMIRQTRTVIYVCLGYCSNWDPVWSVEESFPLLDRVLVEKAWSGIEIPEKAQQKVLQATVVAVGPEARNNQCQHIPMMVKVGDKVLLPESGGTKEEIEDNEIY